MTPLHFLAEAARLQVRCVQVCDNLPLTALRPEALDAFEGRSRELGVHIEVGARGLNPENLRAHLALAQTLAKARRWAQESIAHLRTLIEA